MALTTRSRRMKNGADYKQAEGLMRGVAPRMVELPAMVNWHGASALAKVQTTVCGVNSHEDRNEQVKPSGQATNRKKKEDLLRCLGFLRPLGQAAGQSALTLWPAPCAKQGRKESSRNWVPYSNGGRMRWISWNWTLMVRRRTFSGSGDESQGDKLPEFTKKPKKDHVESRHSRSYNRSSSSDLSQTSPFVRATTNSPVHGFSLRKWLMAIRVSCDGSRELC